MNVVYVTGNPGKAKYFNKLIGLDIPHHSADVDEIQSLDTKDIAIHKAKQAYDQIKKPVIVEDTCLYIDTLNGLPGPFIKWFEITLGMDAICRLADSDPVRAGVASNIHIYYDGHQSVIFRGSLSGTISQRPKGTVGFGFNPIFIPAGKTQTLAEMSENEFIKEYLKIKPLMKVKEFLLNIDKDQA